MLNKTEQMNFYLDFYENCLTDKQKEVMSYYYREDYSYSEIAEILNTSRTAVYDLIKRTESILLDYESKLENYSRYMKRLSYYEKLDALNIKEVSEIVSKCKDTE